MLAVAPTIPHHCSDDFLIACRDLAREYDVGVHSHVAESKVQVVAGYQRYGTTLAAHMDELGLVNERFTVAHGVWLDDDDMKRLGDRGASVAHNPGSNMRLGNGLADVRGMLTRQSQCRRRHRRRQLLGQSEHVRGDAARLVRLQGPGAGRAELAHHRGDAARRHRRQRPCARPGKADRPDRAGLQGRHRVPRPAPHQLDPDQRSGERAGPHRGRHRPSIP